MYKLREMKFAFNNLILFFKIFNRCILLKLPEHFILVKPEDGRFTRKTSTICEDRDVTHIKCSINSLITNS